MPLDFTADELAHIRNDVRLLVSHTRAQKEFADALVTAGEDAVWSAEAAVADSIGLRIERLRDLLAAQLARATASCEAFRELSVSAGQQHRLASRLLDEIDRSRHADETSQNLQADAVLIVDDHQDGRELMAYVLQSAGFMVRTATNGLEALIAACETCPDVIVMDLTMPVLNGIEATRLIKANQATSKARIIAYTGEPSTDDRLDHTLFVAVLRKPADPAHVLAAVRRAATL
jgi:CheY-like chemotaxis protein